MICSGERVPADVALSLGVVDKVVIADLRNEAIGLARRLDGYKRKVSDLVVPECDEASIEKAAASALRAGKNRPAVHAAIDAVLASKALPIDEALARERAAFQSLRTSREARALRYQFFAEREAAKQPSPEGCVVRPIKKIAVIGAGTMGVGIAIAALDSGFEVALFEQEDAALKRGTGRIDSH